MEEQDGKYSKIFYVSELITAGYTKGQIVDRLRKQNTAITKNKAAKIYDEAVDFITNENKKYIANLKDINIQRLTEIYKSSVDNDKTKDALTAVDLMNKTARIYNNKLEIETSGNITFTFGETIENGEDE